MDEIYITLLHYCRYYSELCLMINSNKDMLLAIFTENKGGVYNLLAIEYIGNADYTKKESFVVCLMNPLRICLRKQQTNAVMITGKESILISSDFSVITAANTDDDRSPLKLVHLFISNAKALFQGTYHGLGAKYVQGYFTKFQICCQVNSSDFII